MTQPPSGEWVYFNTEVTNSSGRVSFVVPEEKRLGIGVYPVKMVVRWGFIFIFFSLFPLDLTNPFEMPLPYSVNISLAYTSFPGLTVSRGDHTFADSYLTVVPRGTEFVVFSIDGSFAASVSIMGSDPKVRAGAVDVVRYRDFLSCVVAVGGLDDHVHMFVCCPVLAVSGTGRI